MIQPLEKEQFNILMTMALQCVLDVLQRQLQPYLTGALSNPSQEIDPEVKVLQSTTCIQSKPLL